MAGKLEPLSGVTNTSQSLLSFLAFLISFVFSCPFSSAECCFISFGISHACSAAECCLISFGISHACSSAECCLISSEYHMLSLLLSVVLFHLSYLVLLFC